MSRPPLPRAAAMALALVVCAPTLAWGDITAFFGTATTDGHRSAKGVSLGMSLLVLGFEVEYASMSENEPGGAPAMKTVIFNGVLQSPTGGTQAYASAGGGYYKQTYRDVFMSGFGTNIGGGIKISLAGPVRLRVDYRLFTQRGTPIQKHTQRIYAGINLSF